MSNFEYVQVLQTIVKHLEMQCEYPEFLSEMDIESTERAVEEMIKNKKIPLIIKRPIGNNDKIEMWDVNSFEFKIHKKYDI